MASVSTKGLRYIGETRDQLRHGYGVYKYCNKFFKYEGEWKEGKKHGHGKLLMADGSYYEGEFINGEIEGHGFRKWAATGNTYSGQFYNGELNGHGVMTYGTGAVYEGEWQNNRRQGNGVYKMPDGSRYEGAFHNNQRHGEGSQMYLNKDQYVGDWVNDKRQGSGELRCTDGTIYDGQWRNDMYNGQGTMIHCSGMVYEGMWINGRPEQEATEIVILGETVLELQQGQPFTIEVEIRTAEGNVVDAEQNRQLRISAGFKHMVPSQGMPLFDLIEDLEETPIPTPYGYDVVSYPLTDYDNIKEKLDLDGLVKPSTAATDALTVTTEGFTADNVSITLEGEPEGEGKGPEGGAETLAASEPIPSTAQETTITPSEGIPAEDISESPLPPPVSNQTVEKGKAEFLDLALPPAPLGYQPFSVLDVMLEEEAQKKAKNSKTAGLAGQLRLGAKLNKNTASPTPSGHLFSPSPAPSAGKTRQSSPSRSVKFRSPSPSSSVDRQTQTPGLDEITLKTDQLSITSLKDFKLSKSKREKYYGDLRYSRPGEYVIMVDDMTDPPFMGNRLPTAFCLVKVAFPKKSKKPQKTKKDGKSNSKASPAGGD
ncbi:MORN repeat-containing protein 1-like [Diadema antillarum]|uniref:MORN repeat-containing protein 1-like n=1 Tax=Diadema antillarum TaxID=105358 RepID=UPI003A8B5903